jgi:hypothetical protein
MEPQEELKETAFEGRDDTYDFHSQEDAEGRGHAMRREAGRLSGRGKERGKQDLFLPLWAKKAQLLIDSLQKILWFGA